MNAITKAAGGTLAVTAALLLTAPAGASVDSATATAKTFRNCTALNRVYPHGVGRVGARDKTSGTPVRNFKRSNLLYRQNSGVTATRTESPARRPDLRAGPARHIPIRAGAVLLLALSVATVAPNASGSQGAVQVVYRIDHVTDGDTVVLRNGQKVRLVQIDTPEVYFGSECYGPQASATTKRLLPVGARVRLTVEPATDRVDDFGRLLRYVVRASDGVNVNLRLVAVGAARSVLLRGSTRTYATRLEALAKRAKAKKLGLWGACPRTVYDPYRGVETRR